MEFLIMVDILKIFPPWLETYGQGSFQISLLTK